MASRGKLARSQIGASDVVHDLTCTPCDKDGKNSEAEYQCIECQTYFCKRCVEFHNKFLSAHTVLDKTAMKSKQSQKSRAKTPPTSALPTIMCTEHPGKTIEMFCGHHDVICCTVCIAVKHRSCDGVEYIPTIAKGIAKGAERREAKSALDKTRQDLQRLMSEKNNNLTCLNKQHDDCVSDIRKLKRRVIVRVEELERKSVDMVNTRHRQTTESIKTEISSINDMLKSIDFQLDKVNKISDDNETELFIEIKQSQVQTLQSNDVIETFDSQEDQFILYDLNTEIESILKDVQTFVCIKKDDTRADAAYTATFLDRYNVKVKGDNRYPYVYGCCSLDSNQIIITDINNGKLKRLNLSFKVTDWIDISGGPYGVCNTGKSEVALTLRGAKKVQFLSVGKTLSLTHSFSVGESCRDICCSKGHLYICLGGNMLEGPGQVKVYNMSGSELNVIKTDESGQNIVSYPQGITVTQDSSRLHVADGQKGIISVEINGNQFDIITDTVVKKAIGITVDDRGNTIACGFSSNNVIQIDRHGNVLRTLLSETDGIKWPVTLHYLQNPRRLLVCEANSEMIKLYKLT